MKEVIKDILQIGRGKDLESEDVIKLLWSHRKNLMDDELI
jgi:hypothetical protein